MKYLKSYNESRLVDDYTKWFLKNIDDISPLINSIKLKIKENSPEYLNEFYYRITNNEDLIDLIDDIYKKGNIIDEESLIYLNELKRRNKMSKKISNINK